MPAHKFDPKHAAKLNDPKRRSIEDPDRVFNTLALHSGMTVVDLGAGSGFYTRPLSARLGGKVFACDVSEQMLSRLRSDLSQVERERIEVIRIGEKALPFATGGVDVVLMANVLHELEHPGTMLAEIQRIVNAAGWVLVVDWKKEDMPYGPPTHARLGVEDIVRFLNRAGFTNIRQEPILTCHNLVLAQGTSGGGGTKGWS